MIQSNELRIGNYVEYNGNEVLITGVNEEFPSINMITCDYLEYDEICSIPLTDQHLLDFGFTIVNEDKKVYGKGRFQIQKIGNSFLETRYGTNLKHVHRLQNLYFEIIKEELKK